LNPALASGNERHAPASSGIELQLLEAAIPLSTGPCRLLPGPTTTV
jgi:hypothetical protein